MIAYQWGPGTVTTDHFAPGQL